MHYNPRSMQEGLTCLYCNNNSHKNEIENEYGWSCLLKDGGLLRIISRVFAGPASCQNPSLNPFERYGYT